MSVRTKTENKHINDLYLEGHKEPRPHKVFYGTRKKPKAIQ